MIVPGQLVEYYGRFVFRNAGDNMGGAENIDLGDTWGIFDRTFVTVIAVPPGRIAYIYHPKAGFVWCYLISLRPNYSVSIEATVVC